jgi:uncharacterized OsmC-like protein
MIVVSYDAKKRFKATTRGHEIIIDVPHDKGGDDLGMMPTEIYSVALAACVGITLTGWLKDNHLSPEGLRIAAQNIMALFPRKIESVKLAIRLKENLLPAQKQELQQVLSSCPVMLSLKQQPIIDIAFEANE